MRRILIVLALAILLLPAAHKNKPELLRPGLLPVSARALALSTSDPALRRVGRLDYIAGWELTSRNSNFGGLSSMLVDPSGQVLALSDAGILMGFHVGAGEPRRRSFIAPLPVRPQYKGKPWWAWDSESMTHDPSTDRYWVGFELQQMICRYSSSFARAEACRTWPEIEAWPETGSIESLTRLPDGRFIAIAEMGMTTDGNHDALLFSDDPADPDTPPPIHLRYTPPQGYRPTDAVALDERHLLVLNRRLTLQELFTGVVAIVELPERLEPDTRLYAQSLARLAPPLLADNFEGLAVTREGGQTMVWIVSDDNHESFQRTLLLKFALR